MLNVTMEQKESIKSYVKAVEKYISEGDIENLLLDLDEAITAYGFDENQDTLTDDGVKLQLIYDQIYNQNKDD